MSKKKNTLKDLNEFLKQQAATLVSPSKLTEEPATKITEEAEKISPTSEQLSPAQIVENLKSLSAQQGIPFRQQFYDLIIQTIESQDQSLPEDKMLINTALYLKSGDRWKETIREYWKGKG